MEQQNRSDLQGVARNSGVRMSARRWRFALMASVVAAPILAGSPTTVLGGFDEGWSAYQRGDFATALKEWGPLAEQGNLLAQYNLGVMYDRGRGVEEDQRRDLFPRSAQSRPYPHRELRS